MASNITDTCPQCHRKFIWDACQDFYIGAEEKQATIEGREVTLHVCPGDGVTFAITVYDEYWGGQVYVPSKKEI